MRPETWHPLFAHFPIALLALTPLVYGVFVVLTHLNREESSQAHFLARFLLWGGLLSYLPSLFLGDIAFDEAKKAVCDLTPIFAHEDHAQITLYFFLTAATGDMGQDWFKQGWSRWFKKSWLPWISLVFMLVGLVFLIKTGHDGAELVYEHGAGVQGYSRECQ